MSNYERLLAAINEHVEAEVRAGRIVDANLAAISLSSQFPQSRSFEAAYSGGLVISCPTRAALPDTAEPSRS
jgi:hypothetical protein